MSVHEARRAAFAARPDLTKGTDGITELVNAFAEETGAAPSTVFHWIEQRDQGEFRTHRRTELNDVERSAIAQYGSVGSAFRALERAGQLTCSRSTFYERAQETVGRVVLAGLSGGEVAMRDAQVNLPSDPVEVNEVWEMDNCRLSLKVTDERGRLADQVWVVAAMDKASRVIVSWRLVLGAPTGRDVAYTLAAGTLGQVLSDGTLIGGIPDRVHTDQGADYTSKVVHEAGRCLRTLLHHLMGYSPHLKGTVERFFGTLGREFIAGLPARTDRPGGVDGSPEDDGQAIPVAHLELALSSFIDHYNTARRHSSLGSTPAEAWIESSPDTAGPSVLAIEPLLVTLPKQPKVTAHGVRYDNTYYTGALLDGVSGRMQLRMVPGARSVELFKGDRHIGRLYATDQLDGETQQEMLAGRAATRQVLSDLRAEGHEARLNAITTIPMPLETPKQPPPSETTSPIPSLEEALAAVLSQTTAHPEPQLPADVTHDNGGQGRLPLFDGAPT